jgi:hypothetical protein
MVSYQELVRQGGRHKEDVTPEEWNAGRRDVRLAPKNDPALPRLRPSQGRGPSAARLNSREFEPAEPGKSERVYDEMVRGSRNRGRHSGFLPARRGTKEQP